MFPLVFQEYFTLKGLGRAEVLIQGMTETVTPQVSYQGERESSGSLAKGAGCPQGTALRTVLFPQKNAGGKQVTASKQE